MTFSRWLLGGIRRYQLPVGILFLATLIGISLGLAAESVPFGVGIFLIILVLAGLRYGVPVMSMWILRRSGILDRSVRIELLYRRLRSEREYFKIVVICSVFTVLGVFMAITERGPDRLVGIGSVLFFGMGGAFFVTIKYLASQVDNDHDDGVMTVRDIHHHGQPYRALVFELPSHRGELGFATLFFVSWTVASVLFALVQSVFLVRTLLFACAILAGGMAFVGLIGFVRGRSTVALFANGLRLRLLYGSVFIPWTGIEGVQLFNYDVSGFTHTLLGVTITDRSMIDGPWGIRSVAWANRMLLNYDITCRMTVGPTVEQFESIVRHFLEQPDKRSRLDRLNNIEDLRTISDAP
jgi:hypothetical protein